MSNQPPAAQPTNTPPQDVFEASSLRQSLERLRKDAQDASSLAAARARETIESTKEHLKELTKTAGAMPELNPNCIASTLSNLHATVQSCLNNFLQSAENVEAKGPDNLICAERAHARLAAVERNVIYPYIRELISQNKLDKHFMILEEVFRNDHTHIENIFGVLSNHYKDATLLHSTSFQEAVRSISEILSLHHSREEAALKRVLPLVDENQRSKLLSDARENYLSVAKEPFVVAGSLKGKVGEAFNEALHKVTGLFQSTTSPSRT